jgi:hypothetical protein
MVIPHRSPFPGSRQDPRLAGMSNQEGCRDVNERIPE